jgi:lysophospholipase L1-like esterase
VVDFLDSFAQPIAYNPDTEKLVADAEFTVHLPDDLSFANPLTVRDPVSDVPISPLRANAVGVLPDFRVPGDPPQVLLKSGSFVTKVTSVFGAVLAAGLAPDVVAEAIAARAAAQSSADIASTAATNAAGSASTAEDAATRAEAVPATTDGLMTSIAEDEDSAFSAQQRAAIGGVVDGRARLVDMLTEGAAADGATDDLAVFVAARTKAGSKGIVHFPAKKGSALTTYFLGGSRPDLSGTQITADPTVVLKMDASPNLKTFGFLSDVTIENTAHSSTLRKRHAVDIPASVGMAANVRPQHLDLAAIDLTTWESLAVESSATGVRTFGTFAGTVTADQVSWGSSFTAGSQGKFVAPAIGVLYEACLETTKAGTNSNNDSAGILLLSSDNYCIDLRMPRASVSPLLVGSNTFAAEDVVGSGSGVTLPAVAGQYGLPSTSGGVTMGFRLLSLREVEFYSNGKMIRRVKTLKDIAKAGFVVGFPDSNVKTIHHAVSYGSKFVPTSARRATVSIIGDSISYGAWTPITYGDLLPIALAGLPGGGGAVVRQNLAVSGSNSTQWANGGTSGGVTVPDIDTLSFAGDDYVLVMIGTNDVQALTSVSTYLANIAVIAAKIVADGARPVFGHFPMFWSTTATGVPGAPGIVNSGRGAAHRAALLSYCAKNGYPVALVEDALGDVYEWLPDNIHPDDRGQAAIARAFAQAIARDRMRQVAV